MNHYEKGHHTPDLATLKKIADKLNVPLNYFFCDTNEMADLIIAFNNLTKEEQKLLSLKYRSNIGISDVWAM